jgi:hypothetical protein
MDVWIDGKPATAHYAGLRDRLFGGTPRAIPWRPVRVGGDGLSGRSSGVEMDSLRYWARALDEAELGGVIDGDGLDAVAVSMLN